jgi:hypothetical protein
LLTLLCTVSLNYKPYSAISALHTFQFTAAHALGFSVSMSRCLVADLNTRTVASNQYELFLTFLLQTRWNADPILQSLYCTVLICTQLISYQPQTHSRYIDAARTRITENTSRDRYPLLCDVTARAVQSNGPCADTKKTLSSYCCVARVLKLVYWAVV